MPLCREFRKQSDLDRILLNANIAKVMISENKQIRSSPQVGEFAALARVLASTQTPCDRPFLDRLYASVKAIIAAQGPPHNAEAFGLKSDRRILPWVIASFLLLRGLSDASGLGAPFDQDGFKAWYEYVGRRYLPLLKPHQKLFTLLQQGLGLVRDHRRLKPMCDLNLCPIQHCLNGRGVKQH